jgi:radical SAM protein with 4Fe4S-binding SPASM domain
VSGYVRQVRELPHTLGDLGRLDLELTERCDNDCIHCCINLPAGDEAARTREMSTEQVKDILRQATGLGCLDVTITGGEPLLRPDFADIYEHARRLGLKVLLYTNARRVTPTLAGLFAWIPPLVPIEVTVYGMHRQSYEAVSRAPGSFAEFRRGVALLLEHEVPFVVKGVLLPPNRHERREFEAWARTIPGMDKAPGYTLLMDLRNRRDDPAKNLTIQALRNSPEEVLAVLAGDEAQYRAEMVEYAARFLSEPGDRLFACGVGRSISVDAYGRAQPCMGLRAPDLTVDVTAAPLAEALARFRELAELRSTSPAYLARCGKCRLRGLCEQCPAKSWSENGTLDTPVEYLCEVAHAQAAFLGWLPGIDAR